MVSNMHMFSTRVFHVLSVPISLKGAIEVTLATMKKADRSKTDEVYVCGFVPNYLLPNKRPCYLDPFLLPLIEELQDLFIHGEIITRPQS